MTIPDTSTPDGPDSVDSTLAAVELTSPPKARGRARRVFRLILLLLVAAAIGVGVYFGWPVVYDRYIRPVEANTAEVTTLQQQLDQAVSRVAELEDETARIRADFESMTGTDAATIEQLDQIAAAVDRQTQRIDGLDAITTDLSSGTDRLDAALERELAVLRSMELLSRARLFLYQANYGLATQDLTSARALLADIETTPDDATQIEEAAFRLDLALGALPDRPVAAADDLDIAWQALLGELPPPVATSVPDTTTTPTSTTAP